MRWLTVVLALLAGQTAQAACRDVTFESLSYSVCEARAGQDLRLFLSGPNGIYGGFAELDADLARSGKALGFAMNAGMFQPDLSPVGLYIENGVSLSKIVTSDGPGNFGLLPNGVFCIGTRFSVVESRTFAKRRRTVAMPRNPGRCW